MAVPLTKVSTITASTTLTKKSKNSPISPNISDTLNSIPSTKPIYKWNINEVKYLMIVSKLPESIQKLIDKYELDGIELLQMRIDKLNNIIPNDELRNKFLLILYGYTSEWDKYIMDNIDVYNDIALNQFYISKVSRIINENMTDIKDDFNIMTGQIKSENAKRDIGCKRCIKGNRDVKKLKSKYMNLKNKYDELKKMYVNDLSEIKFENSLLKKDNKRLRNRKNYYKLKISREHFNNFYNKKIINTNEFQSESIINDDSIPPSMVEFDDNTQSDDAKLTDFTDVINIPDNNHHNVNVFENDSHNQYNNNNNNNTYNIFNILLKPKNDKLLGSGTDNTSAGKDIKRKRVGGSCDEYGFTRKPIIRYKRRNKSSKHFKKRKKSIHDYSASMI